jgi:hypothetical protein
VGTRAGYDPAFPGQRALTTYLVYLVQRSPSWIRTNNPLVQSQVQLPIVLPGNSVHSRTRTCRSHATRIGVSTSSPSRTRTYDTLINSQVPYQLGYGRRRALGQNTGEHRGLNSMSRAEGQNG